MFLDTDCFPLAHDVGPVGCNDIFDLIQLCCFLLLLLLQRFALIEFDKLHKDELFGDPRLLQLPLPSRGTDVIGSFTL